MRHLPQAGRRLFIWAMAAALLAVPASAEAQRRGARLSDDLRQRIQHGDFADSRVIVTGTRERVASIAARHGLRITKPLSTGAVLEIPHGRLRDIVDDQEQGQVPLRFEALSASLYQVQRE